MKKTISITLNGVIFNIEEDAYQSLDTYLESIKKHYEKTEGDEIISDIESSIAEKFQKKINSKKKVIVKKDVEEVVKVMGTVEEIDSENEEKNKNKDSKSSFNSAGSSGEKPKKLYRDPDDVIIAGVCSGIAAYFGIDPVFVRLFFFALLFANGVGFWLYLILWIVVPVAESNSQKLEMRGKSVNIKKLEETIKKKSEEVRSGLKKNGKSKLIKILSFPFMILKNIVIWLRQILSKVWPVISFLVGLGVIIACALGLAAVTMVISVVFFHIDSPFIISDIPLKEFTNQASYYVVMAAAYLGMVIPLIFGLILGSTFVSRKNNFKILSSSILVAVWMIAVVAGGVAAFDLVPRIRQRVLELNQIGTMSRGFEVSDFNKMRIGVNGEMILKKGDEYKFDVTGDEEAIKRLNFEIKDGELKVEQKLREEKGICLFCLSKPVRIEAIVPDLESFIAFRNLDVELIGFDNQDLKINAGESANVKAELDNVNLTSYVAGTSGQVEVSGKIDKLDITTEGNGRFVGKDLDSKYIKIYQDVLSRVTLEGRTEKLEAEVTGPAKLYASDLVSQNVAVKATSHARAEVYALGNLEAIAQEHGRVYYKGEPEKIIHKTAQEGQVIRMEDYEFSDIKFEKNEDEVRIYFSPDKYSPTMSSVRGITLRPEMFGDLGNVIFHWTTDGGNLVVDWDKNWQGSKDVTTREKEVYWTFLPETWEELQIRSKPIEVRLQIETPDESKILNEARLQIIPDEENMMFQVVE